MRYLSVCSGIEAATVAWRPLGWDAIGFSENEKFPSSVLQHHYPETQNFGDMNDFRKWPRADIDVLVGGTPCQSFSVAGLRGGLADPGGNLALVYLAIAQRLRPDWLVWENVPGVLSSNEGRDFGAIIGAMVKLGYGVAWRVLDAQYFGVPQRRRRVFIVGRLGDWRGPAKVLLEPESLRRDPPPSREAGKVAPTIPSRSTAGGGLGTDFDCDGGVIHCPDVSPAMKARDYKGPSSDGDGDGLPLLAQTLLAKANDSHDDSKQTYIAHSLRGEGFDASEDGTGRGTPLVAAPLTAGSSRPGVNDPGRRKQSTVWDIDKPMKSETGHSTQKPVECMARPMRNNSKKGDVVYDPFMGSGTSIVAAETNDRISYGLEIDPGYCDVAVARWEKLTGRKARKHGAKEKDKAA